MEEQEEDPITAGIIGAAIEVHRCLGPGLFEAVYEEALSHELNLRGIRFESQKQVDVLYKDIAIKKPAAGFAGGWKSRRGVEKHGIGSSCLQSPSSVVFKGLRSPQRVDFELWKENDD